MDSSEDNYKSLVQVGKCRTCHKPLYIAHCHVCRKLIKVGHYEQVLYWLTIHTRYNHGEDPL